MSKTAWLGAGGALAALALVRTERTSLTGVERSGLAQLAALEGFARPPLAAPPPPLGTWGALTEAEIIRRMMGVDSVLGVVFRTPLPRAVVGGGWGDSRQTHVGSLHYAIDLAAATGTPIFAATSGSVVWADARGDTTAGKHVVVEQSGVATRYLHMSAVHVARGDVVELGQTLGLVGSTGFSAAPHLHLDVFLSDELLERFRQHYGTPTPPFPRKRRWGTQVPAETLIPVAGHSARVRAAARRRGVTLLESSTVS